VASVVDTPPTVELVTSGGPPLTTIDSQPLFDPVTRTDLDGVRLERAALPAGTQVNGPAVIVEPQTTTILASHHRAVMQTDGSLLVRRVEP